jgi:uncharacterized protein YkwD
VTLHRRTLLALGLTLAAGRSIAATATDAAPPASDVSAWARYEARLWARDQDSGGGRFDAAGAREAFATTNRVRTSGNAPPLAWSDEMALAARAHAGDLAHRAYFDHLSPEGFDPSHRFWLLARATIGSPSENITYQRSASTTGEAMVMRWKSSPGHWRNLLRADHTHGACAMLRQGDRAWLVALYARPLARLDTPLGFRADSAAVSAAVARLPPDVMARVRPPQGARRSPSDEGPRMLQISGVRRGPQGTELIGGPIFVSETPELATRSGWGRLTAP